MTECKHVIAPERMAEGYRENDSGIARHPLLVTLHGLLAVPIVAMLGRSEWRYSH